MKHEHVDPIDVDLMPFVESERGHFGDMPAEVRGRLVAGVHARLAARGGGDGGPDSDGGPARRWVRAYPIRSVLVAMAVGAALSGLVQGVLTAGVAPTPSERIVYVERPAPTAHEVAAPAPPPLPAEVAPVRPPAASAPLHAESPADEAAERLILDDARGALVSGEPQPAWEAIQRHEHMFPRGTLAEERDALAVRALAALGRGPEARDRMDRLRTRFPRSVFLPAAQSALSMLGVDANNP